MGQGLPQRVLRSTFTVLSGMRQPFVRRSWMRLGASAIGGLLKVLLDNMAKEVAGRLDRIGYRPVGGDFVYENAHVIDAREAHVQFPRERRHAVKLSGEALPHQRPLGGA